MAIAAIEALAKFKGETAPVFLRTASLGSRLYVDLCDETWRAVEIHGGGWRVVAEPPSSLSGPEACSRCLSPSAADRFHS